ncbi:DUF202 domain-containing protein [Intrasporangium sp. YIM S08009]|uniref:DUF202 domain-containing protein n=1 Tax=Intrasporangium zincisolvens TaxID=3080018 RepID=UPI002B054AFE|nr:DUF202 domain-containing protein [Intrasporangium sp. YIM S08009]
MTAPPAVPGDRGLQPERTSLAWRRTALSVAVGSLVGLRVLPPHLGVLGYVACALGLVWSIDLSLTSVRRYHRADATVRASESPRTDTDASMPPVPPAGADVARTTAATALVAALALVCVVLIATS